MADRVVIGNATAELVTFQYEYRACKLVVEVPPGEGREVPLGVDLSIRSLGRLGSFKVTRAYNVVKSDLLQLPCAACSKVAKHICSRCQNERYCSKECQRDHWRQHRTPCAEWAKITSQAIHGAALLPGSDVKSFFDMIAPHNL
jgi:hypothetical protein